MFMECVRVYIYIYTYTNCVSTRVVLKKLSGKERETDTMVLSAKSDKSFEQVLRVQSRESKVKRGINYTMTLKVLNNSHFGSQTSTFPTLAFKLLSWC